MKFSEGRKVEHVRYGKAEMHSEYKASDNGRFKGGITLVLLTEEGKELFKQDRCGELPRCFEGNMNNIQHLKV